MNGQSLDGRGPEDLRAAQAARRGRYVAMNAVKQVYRPTSADCAGLAREALGGLNDATLALDELVAESAMTDIGPGDFEKLACALRKARTSVRILLEDDYLPSLGGAR